MEMGTKEIELQGVKIPRVRIPVKTQGHGIISRYRSCSRQDTVLSKWGFDATKTFEERLTNLISKNGED